MKIFLTILSVLAFTWSCGNAASSDSSGGGNSPAGLFISQGGSEIPIAPVKGQDTNFATVETAFLPETVNAIAFGAPANDNQEVTYAVDLAPGESLPAGVTLEDARTAESNVIAFGLGENAGILNVPLMKRTTLVVTMTVTDPSVSALSALAAPDSYSIYFTVESIPRLSSLSLTYSDTDIGNVVIPLTDFDSETFSYELSTPHSLGGGTLSARVRAVNPEGENNYDTTATDVTVLANAERIEFVASANLLVNGGGQSQDYKVVVNLEKPISATRSDNRDPVFIERQAARDFSVTANRVSPQRDLSLTFTAPLNYGEVESTVSYALTSATGYTEDPANTTLYKKTVGADTFELSLSERGILTLPGADSDLISLVISITLDRGTPEDASDDIIYVVSVSSASLPGLSGLTVSYDDGAITFPAGVTAADTNSDIDKNYGRAAVQLVGSASTPYLVDQTSYSVSAERDAAAVLVSQSSAGYFKIGVEAVSGDRVSVMANGIAAYEIGNAGSGVYHVYYGDPNDAVLGVGFLDPSSDTVVITVNVERGEVPNLTSNSYEVNVTLSDEQEVQASSISLVYEDPTRANEERNVVVDYDNNYDEVTGSFSTLAETFVSTGNGTIALSVPYFTDLGETTRLSAEDSPRFGVIGYYLNEVPVPTDVSAFPDGFSRDGQTFEIPLSDLIFENADNNPNTPDTANFYMIAGELATATTAPNTNTGFGVKPYPAGAATPDTADDYVSSANVFVYEITISIEESLTPGFEGLVSLNYDPTGNSLFGDILPINPITNVFVDDAIRYSNLNADGDTAPAFINKDGGELTLGGRVASGVEVIDATYNGRDLTLGQALGGEAITVARGERSGEIVMTLREITDVSNTRTYTINIDFTEKDSVVLGDLTGLEATFTPTGAGLTPETSSAYTTDEDDKIFLSIASASKLTELGGASGGALTVNPSTRGGYGVYISETDPRMGASNNNDFIAFATKVKDAADTTILARNGVSSNIALDPNGSKDLFVVVVNKLIEDLDINAATLEATLATYEATVFPATIGFFDNFQPTLSSLSVAYYGLELLATGDFSPERNSYDASHTNFGGLSTGEGYMVTADAYAEADGITPIATGVMTTTTATATDTSVTLEVVISDGDDTDASVYIDNTYTLNISLVDKTTLNTLEGLVSATNVTVNGASVAGLTFDGDGDDTDNTRTLTYTNAGISFLGDNVLSVTTGDIRGIATVDPTPVGGVSSETITTDGLANDGDVRITLTEDFPTNVYTLLPTSVTDNPLELVYVLENELNPQEPPRNTVIEVRYAGDILSEANLTGTDPDFIYTISGLFNIAGVNEVSITYTIPAGYRFGNPVAPNNYVIDAGNPLTATYTYQKPSGFGTNTIPLADFVAFSVVQVGAPDIYTYTVKGAFFEYSSPVAEGDFMVMREGSDPNVIVGELTANNGTNEVPITLSGLTNRSNEGVTVSLTLPPGVDRDTTNDTNTGTDIITLTISDPDGADTGEIASAEWGRFVVQSNSVRYDLVVSGAFAAQIIPPAPTANQIMAALEGSSLTVAKSGNNYNISGLTNRSNLEGTLALDSGYTVPTGFVLDKTGVTTIPDVTGAGVVNSTNLGTFTVTETAYTNNRQTYNIRGAFARQVALDTPPSSGIRVTLTGSSPAVGTLSGTNYPVTGLTNRDASALRVTVSTTDTYNVRTGFTLSGLSRTSIGTPNGNSASGATNFATFTVSEDAYPANIQTNRIRGSFVAQGTFPVESASGTYGNTSVLLSSTNSSVGFTYVSGRTMMLTSAITDTKFNFKNNLENFPVLISVTVTSGTHANTLEIQFSPDAPSILVGRYTIFEEAYPEHEAERSYTIQFR